LAIAILGIQLGLGRVLLSHLLRVIVGLGIDILRTVRGITHLPAHLRELLLGYVVLRNWIEVHLVAVVVVVDGLILWGDKLLLGTV